MSRDLGAWSQLGDAAPLLAVTKAGYRHPPAPPDALRPEGRAVEPEPPAWEESAACAGIGTAVFFPEPTAIPGRQGTHIDYSAAQAVCDGCPVRAECLEAALERGERDGMWGGLTPRQRKSVRRSGRRQRVCAICGDSFLAAGRAVFCDDVCRATAARRRSAESKRRTA